MGRKVVLYITIVLLSGIFLNVLMVDDSLHGATRSGKILYVLSYLTVLIPLSLPVVVKHIKSDLDWISIALLLFTGWIVAVGKPGGLWYDEKFYYFFGGIVLFVIARPMLQFSNDAFTLDHRWLPVLCIATLGTVEAVMGQLQILGKFPIYHSAYRVTGTFFNPAPFAGFLIASIPYAMLLASQKGPGKISKVFSWMGLVSCMAMIAILPATQSRAGWLGLIAAGLWWLGFYYGWHRRIGKLVLRNRKTMLLALVAVLSGVAGTYGLYQFKKDSADGRLLIWKVAGQLAGENPVAGHGFNTFQVHYGDALADYFEQGKGSPQEELLAGNVQWAFNEPLQLAVELGIPGLLLFLGLVGLALLLPLKEELSGEEKQLVYAARASVAGILVFGLFSYPFYSAPVTLLFFFSLAVIAANIRRMHWKLSVKSVNTARNLNFQKWVLRKNSLTPPLRWSGIPEVKEGVLPKFNVFLQNPHIGDSIFRGVYLPVMFNGMLLVLSMLFGIHAFQQGPKLKEAWWLWDEAEDLYGIRAYEAANESFAEALPVLETNGLFMQQYGKSLFMEVKYEEAIAVLQKGGAFYKDDFWYITLGDAYKETGDMEAAENCYQKAAMMVPHKLYPRYLLAKLYNANGQKPKARAMAQSILDAEVKVMSTAVEEIRKEMQVILVQENEESE